MEPVTDEDSGTRAPVPVGRPARTAPTLRDVAARAGVSAVTVSSVLNGSRSNTRVSAPTRERILAAAADLRYQPSTVARSLRNRRTDILGFYSGLGLGGANAALLFFSGVIGGLQEGCEASRKDLLMHGVFHRRPEEEIYRELAGGKIDGLVMYALDADPLVARLAQSHLPAVALVEAVPNIPSVVADDAQGGRLQAEYLLLRGHRSVLYRVSDTPAPSTARRLRSFLAAAGAAGMRVTEVGGDESGLTGAETRLLRRPALDPARPTAFVCWNDDSARRVLAACALEGIRVGPDHARGEVGVVGFDGMDMPYEPARHLTTIRAPWREAARAAVFLLVSLLEGGDAALGRTPAETVLPVEMIAGDTA